MTTKQYLNALERLGLSPYGSETRDALGLQRRQIARLAVGEVTPTRTLELLIAQYLEHGLPSK